MRMFELPEAVSAVGSSRADRNKRPAPTPGLKKEKRVKHTEVLPRRTSNRLANIAVSVFFIIDQSINHTKVICQKNILTLSDRLYSSALEL